MTSYTQPNIILSSHGNSLFSSLHLLDFNMDNTYEVLLANIKIEGQMGAESF